MESENSQDITAAPTEIEFTIFLDLRDMIGDKIAAIIGLSHTSISE